MGNAPITQLDFDQIKVNLKDYLKGQERFKDYNFEGSNMAVLIDLLAYNTFQNNFFTNMAINEMFLDSAQLRGPVVSHAKTLNYIPRSRVSSQAKVNITLTTVNNPSFVTIPEKTQFIAKCGNKSFSFYTNKSYTVFPVNSKYVAYNVDIYEGNYVNEYYTVNTTADRFILSNTNIDISSVKVFVKDSAGSSVENEYVYRTSVFGASSTERCFYIQAYDENRYELIFGADQFGLNPSVGNIIRVEYRVSSGEEPNGITGFTAASNISGCPAAVTLAAASSNGADREGIESIRFFAPKTVQIQDRAITESDYEILLRQRFPEIQAISVYGGEELDPPRYGKVVIAIDVTNASGLSANDKLRYSNYIKDRSSIGIEPIVIAPQFMYASVSTRVYYDTRKSALNDADIKQKVLNAITTFNDNSLNDFKSTLRVSRLSSAIDAADEFILSNDIEVLPIIPLNPVLNTKNLISVSFNNPLILDEILTEGEVINNHKAAIKSSAFTYNGETAFLIDDGYGLLKIVKLNGVTFNTLANNAGTVDYETGKVIITNLNVSGYSGAEIKLYGRTRVPTIESPKNRILSIRSEDIAINVVGVR